jgi:hypothetical protein
MKIRNKDFPMYLVKNVWDVESSRISHATSSNQRRHMSEGFNFGEVGCCDLRYSQDSGIRGPSSGGRVGERFQAIIQCKILMRGSLEFGVTDDVLAFKDGFKGPLESRLAIPSLTRFARHFYSRDTLISYRRSRGGKEPKGIGPCGPVIVHRENLLALVSALDL